MKMKRLLGGALLLAATGGWSVYADGCCQREFCQNTRNLYPHIARKIETCCERQDAQERAACLAAAEASISEAEGHILAASLACQANDYELMREHIRRLRDILLPKIFPGPNGQIYNTLVGFGRQDWIALDTTLTLAPNTPCKSVTVTLTPQGVINAEATGKAVEDEGGEAGVAVVVPASSTQAYTSCTYVVPSGTTFDMRFAEEYHGVTFSGSIDLARTNPTIPETGLVVAAIPTEAQFIMSKYGHKLRMSLDKTSPYNTLRLGADGKGVLGVALALESDSSALAGLVYVGATVYFEFPVEVNAAWTSVRLNVPRARPGNELTPVEDKTLIVADGPRAELPPIGGDPCADVNGNGIPDGVDRQIHAVEYFLDCPARN